MIPLHALVDVARGFVLPSDLIQSLRIKADYGLELEQVVQCLFGLPQSLTRQSNVEQSLYATSLYLERFTVVFFGLCEVASAEAAVAWIYRKGNRTVLIVMIE